MNDFSLAKNPSLPQKEDLDKVRAKALKGGKKKLKFKGDVITVEVEEVIYF